MKPKVIIENGETTIVLTPENDFGRDIIEKMVNHISDYSIVTNASTTKYYGTHSEHKLTINIKEIRP